MAFSHVLFDLTNGPNIKNIPRKTMQNQGKQQRLTAKRLGQDGHLTPIIEQLIDKKKKSKMQEMPFLCSTI